ncbi:HlyD family secretion protein [Ewingella americana]|uniref:HlyD family secretion protein n=1 Tax=Ewingella americana TaxID=41202 RepID=A0A502GU04_9GAMM|nr:HlyD family secretion protein [Ewingella americana]TPG64942.1 HlyD family secretion protein [Ewingella americana]
MSETVATAPADVPVSTSGKVGARRSSRIWIVSGIALAVASGGALWLLAAPASESTDDAYISVDATTVAPKVKGFVATVLVKHNQWVKAGQPLVVIDSEEFNAHVASAQGDVADGKAQVAAQQAALISQQAQEQLAQAQIQAARTAIRSSLAEQQHAQDEQRRYQSLAVSGATSRNDADRYKTVAITAEQEAAHASAMLDVAQNQAQVTHAQRAEIQAALALAQATVQKAQAALDLAQQDQKHTTIFAAVDGVVGNRQVQTGDYVTPGQRLMTLVPLGDLYVMANFKETQTERIQPGQKASVSVDALPGVKFSGVVDSLAPGSGSTFALLPFEPGTGNFTKIVQRVPVRIRLNPGQPELVSLRPGLSVDARINLRD